MKYNIQCSYVLLKYQRNGILRNIANIIMERTVFLFEGIPAAFHCSSKA